MAGLHKKIMDFCLQSFIGLIMTAGVNVLSGIRHDLNELNTKMSTIVEKVSDHDSRIRETHETISALDHRVRDLELTGKARHQTN